MIYFAKRNLLLFFRDKAAVFFSLLASFIIIGLYVLFLGDTITSNMSHIPNSRDIMDNWIMAGLLAVTSFTTTMGAFGIMIDDKEKKISKDFYSSPLSRKSLTSGYILSAFVIGVIMCLITLVLAEIYIISNGGSLLGVTEIIKVISVIIFTTFMNTSIVFLIVTFINSLNAYSTASSIVGTLIGFITGIYIPIGNLPSTVQWVIKLFPVSHAASITRQIMMEKPLSDYYAVATDLEVNQFKTLLGVTFKIGDNDISMLTSLLILVITSIVFYSLVLLRIKRKK